ncbi:MAG: hypothetical protein A2946_02515 [Candidatus Liptonbacteria bacterium RIFCSPLOWO2_01_FULL_53_13]|uniref:Uncharacterized protein n=1 Tax=Candidatus Liptonbacteria bacterium RIFCSPLOWO2_01_FULL_53_13 TaxID=1798651 RepID=A0A1G2CLR3_9BACT|nr:MAG: hypothetical protein A2946_02515 [Candidatus Liptonbacteria bacterium RIFCSPLOWO2_01_FULL_53_13]
MAEAMEGWTRVSVATKKGERTIRTTRGIFVGAMKTLVRLSRGRSVTSLVGWHVWGEDDCQKVRLRWRTRQADVHVICDACEELFRFPRKMSSFKKFQQWAESETKLAQVRAMRAEAIREECLTGGGRIH